AALQQTVGRAKGGDFLGTVASGFSKPQTPQDKIAFIKEQMPEIIKSQRLIAISVPSNQKNVIDALAATIDGIKTIVQTHNPTDETA
ncbi:hypothetical protein, partial [Rhizobium leguminosarum]|uniref:hypothetical protein n=1 Tax=Rhizobium leguminosarum TaxID=384 RepID=UPI003F9B320D